MVLTLRPLPLTPVQWNNHSRSPIFCTTPYSKAILHSLQIHYITNSLLLFTISPVTSPLPAALHFLNFHFGPTYLLSIKVINHSNTIKITHIDCTPFFSTHIIQIINYNFLVFRESFFSTASLLVPFFINLQPSTLSPFALPISF